MDTMRCSTCGETKPVDDFYRIAKGVDYWRQPCKTCRKAKRRDTYRAEMLKRYSLTPAQYAAMLEAQGGTCGICHQPERARTPAGDLLALSVDHDHKTGQIRGLLCMRCNLILGALEAGPGSTVAESIAIAEAYLRDPEGFDIDEFRATYNGD